LKGISLSLPLSVLCVAGPLEQAGYKVKIIDQRIEKNWRAVLKKEVKNQPLCVGISAVTGKQIKGGLTAAKLVREVSVDTPIVWGRIHPSLLPEQTVTDEYVDIVVKGEGEQTFLDLVKALDGKHPLSEVKGIFYKSKGHIFHRPSSDLLHLDSLPPLPYHLINVNDYLNSINGDGSDLLHFSSRGCPYSCKFCYSQSLNQRKWRYKSPE